MEAKIKHLELIQSIISRMAGNLFFLKGWSITLVTALVAVFTQNPNPRYIMITYLPIGIFWILDGYFLSQERLFRSLYDHVRTLEETDIDFSMDATGFMKQEKNGWFISMFAPTLLFFYIPLIIVLVLIYEIH